MVEREDERTQAFERIDAFAKDKGLDQTPVRGKILEYLFRYARPQYDALVEAGAI